MASQLGSIPASLVSAMTDTLLTIFGQMAKRICDKARERFLRQSHSDAMFRQIWCAAYRPEVDWWTPRDSTATE